MTLSEEMLNIHISNASVDWGTLVDCSDSELVVRSMTDMGNSTVEVHLLTLF